jgi:hypothetical protein
VSGQRHNVRPTSDHVRPTSQRQNNVRPTSQRQTNVTMSGQRQTNVSTSNQCHNVKPTSQRHNITVNFPKQLQPCDRPMNQRTLRTDLSVRESEIPFPVNISPPMFQRRHGNCLGNCQFIHVTRGSFVDLTTSNRCQEKPRRHH